MRKTYFKVYEVYSFSNPSWVAHSPTPSIQRIADSSNGLGKAAAA